MSNLTTIHNKYKEPPGPEDVYIGRPSQFGNNYVIGRDGTREEVIAKYKVWFYDRVSKNAYFRNQVLALKGKRLFCFCKPQACHGDIICEYLNNL